MISQTLDVRTPASPAPIDTILLSEPALDVRVTGDPVLAIDYGFITVLTCVAAPLS